jgi:hypothetical protein
MFVLTYSPFQAAYHKLYKDTYTKILPIVIAIAFSTREHITLHLAGEASLDISNARLNFHSTPLNFQNIWDDVQPRTMKII